MPYDTSSYSSLGRRTSHSFSSGSARNSFSSDYSSGSSYGFTPGFSSMGSSSSFSLSGRSGSIYSSRSSTPSSFSSLSSREGSFLSSSMVKRDTLINSLVRTSHDLSRHDFLPSDATSIRTGSDHVSSHRSYPSIDRCRSRTTDLSLSSLAARTSSDLGSFASYTTTSGYGTTYRSTYRPILIQRPSFDKYTPRPREERLRDKHFMSIRRDRPLVKFREKDDVSPEKVRQLLDSWSPEIIEENEEDDYETRKRDSVRSNDSGIGSFRSSFGKRSCKKSGDFSCYDLSPTIDEKDSGTEDNDDLNSDKRCGRYRSVDHVSSVDEGVHMDAEFDSRSPRDILSPLGFSDTAQTNSRPLSRNDVSGLLGNSENLQFNKTDNILRKTSESLGKTSSENKDQHPESAEIKLDVEQGYSETNIRKRRRDDLDTCKKLAKSSTDTVTIAVTDDVYNLKPKTEEQNITVSGKPNDARTRRSGVSLPEVKSKTSPKISISTDHLKKTSSDSNNQSHIELVSTTISKTEKVVKSDDNAKNDSKDTSDKTLKKKKVKELGDLGKKLEEQRSISDAQSKVNSVDTNEKDLKTKSLNKIVVLDSPNEAGILIGKSILSEKPNKADDRHTAVNHSKVADNILKDSLPDSERNPDPKGKMTTILGNEPRSRKPSVPTCVPMNEVSRRKDKIDKMVVASKLDAVPKLSDQGKDEISMSEKKNANETIFSKKVTTDSSESRIDASKTSTLKSSPNIDKSLTSPTISKSLFKISKGKSDALRQQENSDTNTFKLRTKTTIDKTVPTPETKLSKTKTNEELPPVAKDATSEIRDIKIPINARSVPKSPTCDSKPPLYSSKEKNIPITEEKSNESISRKTMTDKKPVCSDQTLLGENASDKLTTDSVKQLPPSSKVTINQSKALDLKTLEPQSTEKLPPSLSSSKMKLNNLQEKCVLPSPEEKPKHNTYRFKIKAATDSKAEQKLFKEKESLESRRDSKPKLPSTSNDITDLSDTKAKLPSASKDITNQSDTKAKLPSASKDITNQSDTKAKLPSASKDITSQSDTKAKLPSAPKDISNQSDMKATLPSASKDITNQSDKKAKLPSASKDITNQSDTKAKLPCASKDITNQLKWKPKLPSSSKDIANQSETCDLEAPFSSQNTDKGLISTKQYGTEPNTSAEKRDLSTERKSKVSIPSADVNLHTDKNVPCSDEKLLREKTKEKPLPDYSEIKSLASSPDTVSESETSKLKTPCDSKTIDKNLVATVSNKPQLTDSKSKGDLSTEGKLKISEVATKTGKDINVLFSEQQNLIKERSGDKLQFDSDVKRLATSNEAVDKSPASDVATPPASEINEETFNSKPHLKHPKQRSDCSLKKKSEANISVVDKNSTTDKNVTCTEPQFPSSEEKAKSRFKAETATGKMTPFSEQRLSKEKTKEQRSIRENGQLSKSEDTANLEESALVSKAEKEVRTNQKVSLLTNVKEKLEGKIKQTDAAPKSSDSTAGSAAHNKPSTSLEVPKAPSQENSLLSSSKIEETWNVLENSKVLNSDLKEVQKDAEICEVNSSEKNSYCDNKSLTMLEQDDTHSTTDVKQNSTTQADKSDQCEGDFVSEIKTNDSDARVDEITSTGASHPQKSSEIADSDVPVSSASELPKSGSEESKNLTLQIRKSSSEDFKSGKTGTRDKSILECFKLQKSSSADTTVTKHSKPPLPLKTVTPPGLPVPRKEKLQSAAQSSEKNNTFHQLQKSSTAGKMNLNTGLPETPKLNDLQKSFTTECSRLARKPLIKDIKIFSNVDCLTQQAVKPGTSTQHSTDSSQLNDLSRQNLINNQSAEVKRKVLKPKKLLSRDNIPKESALNSDVLEKSSGTEDTLAVSEFPKITAEISSSADSTANFQETENETSVMASSELSSKEAVPSEKLNDRERASLCDTTVGTMGKGAQVSEQKDESTISSIENNSSTPTPRVSRPYVPKNRLVLSKSDSNVPMRQLMTSSSAPNIAIEQVRAKLAKKTGLPERLGRIPHKITEQKCVNDVKEKVENITCNETNLTIETNLMSPDKVPDERKSCTISSENLNVSPVSSELSNEKSEHDSKDKLPILPEPVISEDDGKLEEKIDYSDTCSIFTNENFSEQKVTAESENTKQDNRTSSNDKISDAQISAKLGLASDSLKTCSVSEVCRTEIKQNAISDTKTTSVDVSEISTCKSDSVQTSALGQLITTKVAVQCIHSEQQLSVKNHTVPTEIEPHIATDIPPIKEKRNANETVETLANKCVPDTSAVDSTTVNSEEVRPKVKKVKKPKVEGEEKVKKKKKKKEKTEGTDEKPAVNEQVGSDKSTVCVSEKQGLCSDNATAIPEPKLQQISEACKSADGLKPTESEESPPEQSTECKTNCHKKCEKSIPHLCGVNEKLLSEVLATVKKDLASPSQGVTNEASTTSDTSIVNNRSQTPPPSPAISDTEDVCDHLWGENKRSESTDSFRQSRNATPIRFKKYSVEDFHFLKVLGRGSYGKVMLAELKGHSQYFAVKCLKKDVVLEDNDVECTMIEKKVLAMGSSHPYLCTLLCTFQSQSHLFFVMEYLSGGDLMFHIQQSGRFDQERARFYAAEIVCALKHLHKRGIVYRDAKLDNICLDADGHIRLVDFGFCKLRIYRKECLPRNLCGTPDYMAPEIIKGHHYNQSVDWWSFGVLLYEMLIGQSPFNGTDEEELFWSVCNEEAYYPRFLSKESKQILVLLLEKNPEKRLGMPGCVAGDICHQPFFRLTNWERVEKKEIEPPFKPKLKSETDVSNFDSDFTMEKAMLTPIDKQILDSMDQNQFEGFSYTNPHIKD